MVIFLIWHKMNFMIDRIDSSSPSPFSPEPSDVPPQNYNDLVDQIRSVPISRPDIHADDMDPRMTMLDKLQHDINQSRSLSMIDKGRLLHEIDNARSQIS
jgi:hypothetical protein